MTTEPQEHDFIAQVCAEDAPKRLSDDPAVRLAECRGEAVPEFDEKVETRAAHFEFDGYCDWPAFLQGWLACAKSRAEGK